MVFVIPKLPSLLRFERSETGRNLEGLLSQVGHFPDRECKHGMRSRKCPGFPGLVAKPRFSNQVVPHPRPSFLLPPMDYSFPDKMMLDTVQIAAPRPSMHTALRGILLECRPVSSSITHCQSRAMRSSPFLYPSSRCGPAIQVWACGPGESFKPSQSLCSMPLALRYIGYITNGYMTEAMQIRDIPKLISIIKEQTFMFWGAHCKGKPRDTEAMVLFRIVCLRANLV